MPLGVRRVEVDHLDVRMEGLENGFARHAGGERGDGGEDGFRHDDCDAFVMVCAMLREDGGDELGADCIWGRGSPCTDCTNDLSDVSRKTHCAADHGGGLAATMYEAYYSSIPMRPSNGLAITRTVGNSPMNY